MSLNRGMACFSSPEELLSLIHIIYCMLDPLSHDFDVTVACSFPNRQLSVMPSSHGSRTLRSANSEELFMIDIQNLSKTFSGGKGLDQVSLHIQRGEMVALIGSSGSGKSTLMRHIAGLIPGDATGGRIEVARRVIQDRGVISRDIRDIRADIGMIFQQFNLVDRMSVLRNVTLGALSRTSLWRSLLGLFHEEDTLLAYKALSRVGIVEKARERTSNLSGGQQQRAAIARALVQRARVLLADEPIASLDPESSRNVMETLRDLNRNDGLTVVVTLHQVDYALSFCPRTVALKHGRVVFDGPSAELTPAFLRQLYGTEGDFLFARPESDIRRTPALEQACVA